MDSNKEHEDLSNKKDGKVTLEPPYRHRNPGLRAECIYFYYLKMSKKHGEKVRAYFVDRKTYIPWNTMEAEMKAILEAIKDDSLRPCGWNLGDLKWRRKSYFAVVMEGPAGKLEEGNAVTFTPDHAFRDGKDIKSFPRPFENISGFYCLNNLQNQGGVNVPDDKYEEIEVEANHLRKAGVKLTARRDHSDTGTNMGPPIGQP